jgi:leader peptidase (prepilin peptidase)/N-methyltransferase
VNFLLAIPVELRLALLFVGGALVGGQLNRGIYRLAWHRRLIGPWSAPDPKAPPRQWWDRVPIVGWWGLRRESKVHGRGFWVRPMLIELATAIGFAWLYQWEIEARLLPVVAGVNAAAPALAAMWHSQYLLHVVLISLMIVATFIDFDEKTIPDEITVPGTLAALVLAATLPLSRLPVVERSLGGADVDRLLLTSPAAWPGWLDERLGLACGLACFVAWCLAISHWRWITRRGLAKAFQYLAATFFRDGSWRMVLVIAIAGSMGIAAVWWRGGPAWPGLLSALVGMAFGGGLIWGVRIVGGRALGQEAMGFGDVTLLAMIGAFLGWQPSLVIFFMAPLTAVVIALIQTLLTGHRYIAFGPYLCVATLILILAWSRIWDGWADGIFSLGWFIPEMVGVCLVLMGLMLWGWRLIRERLFGY